MTWALLAFAGAFLIVAVLRIVEFKAAGISDRQIKWLVPIHLLGSCLFTAALALLALDPTQAHKNWMAGLFFGAVFLLFPMQIYVALKRKTRVKS